MLRCAAELLHESLDLVEPDDHTLLARRASAERLARVSAWRASAERLARIAPAWRAFPVRLALSERLPVAKRRTISRGTFRLLGERVEPARRPVAIARVLVARAAAAIAVAAYTVSFLPGSWLLPAGPPERSLDIPNFFVVALTVRLTLSLVAPKCFLGMRCPIPSRRSP